jgi:type I restriction enzyme, R subunit
MKESLSYPYVAGHVSEEAKAASVAADSAIDIWAIVQRNRKVGFWDDLDAQRRTMNEIDDYLYDELKENKG